MTGLPIKYRWQAQLRCEPHQVWTLIADEFKLCSALGLRLPAEHADSAQTAKAEKKALLYRLLEAAVPLARPPEFSWIQDHELTATFTFHSRVISKLTLRVKLEPDGQGTQVRSYVTVYPTSLLGKLSVPFLIGRGMRQHLAETYNKIDAFASQKSGKAFVDELSHLSRTAEKQVQSMMTALTEEGYRELWVKQLVAVIAYEPDCTINSIEPAAFAIKHSIPLPRAVDLLISAVREHLLKFQWRLRCPRCMEARYIEPHLKLLPTVGHCPRCDVRFRASLSKNTELAFQPHPSVRRVKASDTEVIDPLSRPQEFLRLSIEPGETLQYELDLAPGSYRVRTGHTGPSQWYQVEVSAGKRAKIDILIFDDRFEVTSTPHAEIFEIKAHNSGAAAQTLIVENLLTQAQALQATRVVTNQHFRNYFPSETVHEEAPVSLGSLALLACDVVGSTQYFAKTGDERGYRLIREFYRFMDKNIRLHDGAIINGAGDYVLAAFVNPVLAIKAVLKLRESMDAFNATLAEGEGIVVRLSLHYGPCLAINISQVLDFFGYHINVAGALQQFSGDNDVVISEQLWKIPEVRHLLDGAHTPITPFTVNMPAWGGEIQLYRLLPNQMQPASPEAEGEGAPLPATLGSDAPHRFGAAGSEHQNPSES